MTTEEYIEYEWDVREAAEAFPSMEVGAAYRKFMLEVKKQEPRPLLRSDDKSIPNSQAKPIVLRTFKRPCTQVGCAGIQVLQGVCGGCAAGKKGYLSLWECEECLYREFSKRPYLDWYKELTKKEEV